MANGFFDPNENEVFQVKVLDTKKIYRHRNVSITGESYHYSVRLKDWRNDFEVVELSITNDEYNELEKEKNKRYITIITKSGYLGEEWFVSIDINPVGQKEKVKRR